MTQADLLVRARDEGSLAAARELRRLKLDQRRAVDIFRVIVDSDLWLLFQPLDKLLGAYARGGRGILINSQRPRGMQRLTAAHEYGHHVLGHEESADDEARVQNPSSVHDPYEAAAQAFAMDFLMPPQLVNALWSALDVPASPEAYHAYLLSLYLGASYQATVHQLFAMTKISDDVRGRLLKVQPKRIKQEIGRGIGPGTAHADIWPVDPSHDRSELAITVDDEVGICLPEAPSTGYLWVPEMSGVIDLRSAEEGNEPGPEHVLGLVRTEFESAERNLFSVVGSGGHRYFTFRALRPGMCDLRLTLRRPWLPAAAPAEEFILHLGLLSKPAGEREQGLFDGAKDLLTPALAA
jgi:Zn-dependent peptidase ImmA (M78 family)/predicted secreted protein